MILYYIFWWPWVGQQQLVIILTQHFCSMTFDLALHPSGEFDNYSIFMKFNPP